MIMQYQIYSRYICRSYIVAYLDGLQVKVNALRGLQSASGEELSPPLRFGDLHTGRRPE
jgi:hypothetical protein